MPCPRASAGMFGETHGEFSQSKGSDTNEWRGNFLAHGRRAGFDYRAVHVCRGVVRSEILGNGGMKCRRLCMCVSTMV